MEDQELQELKAHMKVKADEDLYFFIHTVCEFGSNPDPDGPKITEDQHELCNFLQAFYEGNKDKLWEFFRTHAPSQEDLSELSEEKLRKVFEDRKDWLAMVLTPRDTLKSTVLQGFVLWMLIKKPDIRILLYGEVHEQAQKRLAVIKRVVQTGKYFRFVYGNLDGSKQGLPWNENMFVSAARRNMNIREASVETAGLDVTVNARHFDIIIPDDLHSEKNTKSKDQIEDIKEKVQLLLPLKTKGGKVIVAGVFWNDSDVHTWMKDEHKPQIFLKDAYKDKDEKVSAYPNALPVSELELRKTFMRSDLFACHYRMNPVSKQNISFPKDYFRVIPKEQFNVVRVYLEIDPAGDPTSVNANKRDSDYCGMVAWGANLIQDVILLDGYMDKVSPTEAVEYAIQLILKYKPFIVGIERAGMGNLAYYVREEMRKRGIFAIVDENLPGGRSKHARTMELEPYARRRKMYIAEDCPIKDQFLEQITKVTPYGIKSKFDDLIDPTAYLIDHFKKYGLPHEQQEEPGEEKIPPELLALNPSSRWYWMNANKKENKIRGTVGEFFS